MRQNGTRGNGGPGAGTGRRAAWLAVMAGAGALLGVGGCAETDAWLLDPSVIGRWERTPTSVPILTRIASIEGPEDEFVELTSVTPEDLIPVVEQYRMGPGDVIEVVLWDHPVENQFTTYELQIDPRGTIAMPQVGEVDVSGLSTEGAARAIADALREQQLLTDAIVHVRVLGRRQVRVSVLGAVGGPGQFFIPSADYRLLEALTAAGGFSEGADHVYVIRQVPLAEDVTGRRIGGARVPDRPRPAPPEGRGLADLIEELADPDAPVRERPRAQPPPEEPREPAEAPIPLIEPPGAERAAPGRAAENGESSWMYLNGEWVLVRSTPRAAQPGAPGNGAPVRELVSQRVIRVPIKPLTAGDARYNIVIRPGDVIRVPPAPQGFVYMGGQINRSGSFSLVQNLTLSRAISAAGGLSQIAIPDRVDITRQTSEDRQSTIRVNLRAIFEGTQPDLFLKANDHINIGTSFWATPMAVIRNGFRTTYGFGFLLDRNFGNDVFGAPPGERISFF